MGVGGRARFCQSTYLTGRLVILWWEDRLVLSVFLVVVARGQGAGPRGAPAVVREVGAGGARGEGEEGGARWVEWLRVGCWCGAVQSAARPRFWPASRRIKCGS